MRAIVALPSFPGFLYWQNSLTIFTVVVLLTVQAVALVRLGEADRASDCAREAASWCHEGDRYAACRCGT